MVARVLVPWLPSWRNTIPSPPAGDHQGPPHRPSSTLAPTEYPTPFREVDTSWTTLAVTPALQTETSIFLSRFFTVSSAIGRFQLSPGFCAADMVDG